ncbi:MAG: alpha,2-mannosyltransferase [Micromonosporaceae bacterium]
MGSARITVGRVASWLPAGVLAAVTALAALTRRPPDRLADLHVYVGAVSGLRHHHSLYDFITGNGAPFTYPPFAGLVLLPLAHLPEWPIGVAWTVAKLAVVAALAVLAGRAAQAWYPRRVRPWLAPALAAALFASAPVSSDLRFGQVSVVLATLVLADLTLARPRYRGVLTGLATAVKLTPLIFIPLLWLGGRRRAALTAVAACAAATGLAWAVLPGDSLRFWGTEVWRVGRLGHITTGGNQSFNGALLRLGLAGPPRALLTLAVAALVGCLALWRGARAARAGDWLSAGILAGAASVVISPVSWTHHQVWLVLAAVLPVRGPAAARVAWPLLVLAVMIPPVLALGALPGPAGVLLGNLRLLLAAGVAALVPLARPPGTASVQPQGQLAAQV